MTREKSTASPGTTGNDAQYPGEPAELIPGRVILDDFRVVRLLGRGGMGAVYLVERLSDGEQFAVKTLLTSRVGNPERQRLFFRELRTWMELPEHPHLAACRFFRTHTDRILIFAEYVGGGSLTSWIREGRIQGLEQILDIAIQSAWGIHAAHETGLIHQDVKPANLLLTETGTVKVADFGLAQVLRRMKPAGITPQESGESILVSSRGMTLAYCSPEQFTGRGLNRRTDIWSWGLSVLEMFSGGVTWKFGALAPQVLQRHLDGPANTGGAVIPAPVADVLQMCFQEDPADRWSSIQDAADRLSELVPQLTGRAYSRSRPVLPEPVTAAVPRRDIDRSSIEGYTWSNPFIWLHRAWRAAGTEPENTAAWLTDRPVTRKGQVIRDLELYGDAVRIFSGIPERTHETTRYFAVLHHEKAFIHETIHDYSGAFENYARSEELLTGIPGEHRDDSLIRMMSSLHTSMGLTRCKVGDIARGIEHYDCARDLLESEVSGADRHELRDQLAKVYGNKGIALCELQQYDHALAMYDTAITIREQLVYDELRVDLRDSLAVLYTNRAIVSSCAGDPLSALTYYDKSIDLLEEAARGTDRVEILNDLAMVYSNKAIEKFNLEAYQESADLYSRAIAIYQRLIHDQDRDDLLYNLGTVYSNLANTFSLLNDPGRVDMYYGMAIDIYETLFRRDGRTEVAGDLAEIYSYRAKSLMKLHRYHDAIAAFSLSVDLFRSMGHLPKKADLYYIALAAKVSRAVCLAVTGNVAAARSESAAWYADLEEAVTACPKIALKTDLTNAKQQLDPFLIPHPG